MEQHADLPADQRYSRRCRSRVLPGRSGGISREAISGGAIPADTLYIVAGCYYENDSWVQKDASNNGALSSLSKGLRHADAPVQDMAVRKRRSRWGKPIQECTADELETIAFWVETLTTSAATEKSQLGQFIVPISEIESKMRMKVFGGFPTRPRAGPARCRRVGIDGKGAAIAAPFETGQSGQVKGRQSQRDADRRTHTSVHRVVFAQIDA